MSSECYLEYDEIFLFCTWGDPSEWARLTYHVTCFEDPAARKKWKSPKGINAFTTTEALLKTFSKPTKKISLMVFTQDTLLLNAIRKDEENRKNLWLTDEGEMSKKRGELYKLIIQYLSNNGAFREVSKNYKDISSGKDCDKGNQSIIDTTKEWCVVLPGVASYREGPELFNWRCDRCYEVIVGGMVIHALRRLLQSQGKNVAVLLDTSHGVNYFAVALKEAIPLACSLYVVKRASSGDEEFLLHLYHYNAQPVIKPELSVGAEASTAVEIISFTRMGFQNPRNSHKSSVGYYFEIVRENVEEVFSNRTFEGTIDSLSRRMPWLNELQKCMWEKIAASALLFVRGALPWALRIAGDLELRPSELLNGLASKLDDVELKLKTEKKTRREIEYTATYSWSSVGAPDAETTTLAFLAAILGEGFRNVFSRCELGACSKLKEVREVLDNFRKEVQNGKPVENALRLLDELTESCVSAPLASIGELAAKVYSEPFNVIVQTEIERIEGYFRGVKSEKVPSVTLLPENDVVVKCGALEVFLPAKEGLPNERHFYAHMGLVRGTSYAIMRSGREYYLLLGPYTTVLQALKMWLSR